MPDGAGRRPTPADLAAAAGRTIPDLLGPGLSVVFCGINPGLWSAATGYHFARPGNRFWKVLCAAGFTERVLDPSEGQVLIDSGIGITNLVARSSATAAELTTPELRAGVAHLEAVAAGTGAEWVAFCGMGAYRTAFKRPRSTIGPQAERLGSSGIWLLPNPSGLQARYQFPELVQLFSDLRAASRL